MLKKFSFAYVKQHPVMFGAIVLVFGVLFWLLLNKHASAAQANAGGTTVINPGPSDAQIAAGVALQQAQLGANRDIAIANLSAAAAHDANITQMNLAGLALQQNMASIQADYSLGKSQIESSVAALGMQLANNLAITNSNNGFMLDYAKQANDAATQQLMIGATLQATLGAQSLEGYKYAATLSVIPTLKEGKRDNAFALLASGEYGITGADAAAIMAPNGGTSGGGFNPVNVILPITNLL